MIIHGTVFFIHLHTFVEGIFKSTLADRVNYVTLYDLM